MSDDCEATPISPFDHAIHGRVASLEDSRRAWRWIIGLAAPAVIALMLWTLDRVQTAAERAGRSEATMDGIKRQLDMIETHVLRIAHDTDPGKQAVVAVGAP